MVPRVSSQIREITTFSFCVSTGFISDRQHFAVAMLDVSIYHRGLDNLNSEKVTAVVQLRFVSKKPRIKGSAIWEFTPSLLTVKPLGFSKRREHVFQQYSARSIKTWILNHIVVETPCLAFGLVKHLEHIGNYVYQTCCLLKSSEFCSHIVTTSRHYVSCTTQTDWISHRSPCSLWRMDYIFIWHLDEQTFKVHAVVKALCRQTLTA
jgi:hypothetical protein